MTSFRRRTLRSGLALVAVTAFVRIAPGAEPAAAPPTTPPLAREVTQLVEAAAPRLEPIYLELHTHPELSGQEEKSAARVATGLEAAGFATTRNVGGHGVVGVLRNGEGPTVLIRTDLDALPLTEQTGAAYASTVPGVMHACGHDVHMTVFLGAAELLGRLRERWRGTVVMIGQPAEEKVQGAKAMLADGLYTRFPRSDVCLALHCAADLAVGKVGVTEGYAMANVDSVDIVIRGVGGHGAWPHKTKDPVVLAAQTVMALQTIVSRETEPTQPAVVTVGSIHGGTKHNIIPDEVRLQLTVRSYSAAVRQHPLEAIRRITRGLALAAGLPEDRMPVVTVSDESASATYNNPELARRLRGVFQRWLGSEQSVATTPSMGAEDFGLFGRTEPPVPICMVWLGTVAADRVEEARRTGTPLPALHSSRFLPVYAPAIKTGVTALTAATLELLAPAP